MAKPRGKPAPLPTRQDILDFILGSETPVGKREIARAFHLRGHDRVRLKDVLRELEEEGLLQRGRKRRLAAAGSLPPVGVVEISGTDGDGELLARPTGWREKAEPPRIYMAPERAGRRALATGDRVLARLRQVGAGTYEGRVIRILAGEPGRILGVYNVVAGRGHLRPTDRRHKDEYLIAPEDAGEARSGDLVVAESLPGRPAGRRRARIVERLGNTADPRTISLVSIHSQGIPTRFPAAAIKLAEAAEPADPDGRVDLRAVPLVTIDGPDARDFDDAVWAEPDDDENNPGGWHLLVAIADVAHYVRPGDALDKAAYERGNSAYFPDRVIPMLPEALSNGLCSLRPGEDRACLAVHIWLDGDGTQRRHRFERGLMRSAARLTYTQVQTARNGHADDQTGPLLDGVITPLYGAFEALLAARQRRGALDIDLPERRVLLDDDGMVSGIAPQPRLDSHRLIEEFMIAANVAAAETLERTGQPCMYRIHDRPDPVKVEALRRFLGELGIRLARGQLMRPQHFTALLRRAAKEPFAALINQLVLRSQAQAAYSPENVGHFGLGLERYSHFTSPIRRYADLLVHRALIRGCRLGAGGLPRDAEATFAEAGLHISEAERRAEAAERDAVDRFTVAFLADRVGSSFAGGITGVTRFGLFVQLTETGADGLVPVSTLNDDYYEHDEERHRLTGRHTGQSYRLGDAVRVRLESADPVTGGLVLGLLEARPASPTPSHEHTAPRRRKPRKTGENRRGRT